MESKVAEPIEEAIAFQRMLQDGRTADEIAKSIGRSRVYVDERVMLLNANPKLLEAVQKGHIPHSLAQEIMLVTKGDKAAEVELTEVAAEGKSGRKQARKVLAKKRTEKAKTKAAAKAKKEGKPESKVLTPMSLSDQKAEAIGAAMRRAADLFARRHLNDIQIRDALDRVCAAADIRPGHQAPQPNNKGN